MLKNLYYYSYPRFNLLYNCELEKFEKKKKRNAEERSEPNSELLSEYIKM